MRLRSYFSPSAKNRLNPIIFFICNHWFVLALIVQATTSGDDARIKTISKNSINSTLRKLIVRAFSYFSCSKAPVVSGHF
ncbi:MAG: hypothetical protein C3F02_04355 [Parcubacteria group bacterium]|nr:MAG: hypothetical protein C3F02_04355 [Parcubacteria group bacterium]